jgi:hypothetical protein
VHTADLLESITLQFPASWGAFNQALAALLAPLGAPTGAGLEFARSDPGFTPRVRVDFGSDQAAVNAEFALSSGERLRVELQNTTGISRRSPHAYAPVAAQAVSARLGAAGLKPVGLDHAGINLPWFEGGLHPQLRQLRAELRARCLYHGYPTGEPWDFILPGDADEIVRARAVDYSRVRKPKFELVSFEKASTPLVQFDLAVDGPYEQFGALFPEALDDPQYRNIWVYLETPLAVDVCLVLNTDTGEDWSGFFEGHRVG